MKQYYPWLCSLLFLLSACSQETTETGFEVTTDNIEGNVPAMEREEDLFGEDFMGHIDNVDLSTLPPSGKEGVDIDLTQFSSSMVYAIVYQMVFYPEDFVGLTIHMEGKFFIWENPETGREYYSTIVEDALACCQQGLEFILAEGEYPALDTPIAVTGELELYEEYGYENIRLINARFS